MGHYCRICGRSRANEKFTGKGHHTHVCKDCAKRPRVERERIEQIDEILGFLDQSNISAKNLKRLEQLAASAIPEVKSMAAVVLEVGRVKPHRRRRVGYLRRNHPELWQKMAELDMLEIFEEDSDFSEDGAEDLEE